MNKVIKNGDKIDFSVDCGSTWTVRFDYTDNDGNPIDLLGYIGRMYLKRNYNTPSAFEISTVIGNMVVANGYVTWTVTDEETSTLLSGSYIYDVELESYDGTVSRFFEGKVVFNPEVTR